MTGVDRRTVPSLATLKSTLSKALPIAVGAGLVLGAWEVIGQLDLFPRAWPPLSDVWSFLLDSKRSAVLRRALPTTARSALLGLTIGAFVGTGLALLGVIFRWMRAGLERAVTANQAIPIIAYAPILIITVGRELAPTYSAALVAIYPMWLTVSTALLRAPDVYAHVGVGTGASRGRAIRWMFLPNALPSILDGLRLAAPSAIIGAIIGEWFGAEQGLGVVIISSLLNNQVVQLWAAALVGSMLSLVAYGTFTTGHVLVLRRRAI